MAYQSDWIQDAAEEIVMMEYPSPRQIYEVIAKHCPFKPDTAYQEVPAADDSSEPENPQDY
jgi:hypothetical protein